MYNTDLKHQINFSEVNTKKVEEIEGVEVQYELGLREGWEYLVKSVFFFNVFNGDEKSSDSGL